MVVAHMIIVTASIGTFGLYTDFELRTTDIRLGTSDTGLSIEVTFYIL